MLLKRKIKDRKISLEKSTQVAHTALCYVGVRTHPHQQQGWQCAYGDRIQHGAGAFQNGLPPGLHPKEESISLRECKVGVQIAVASDKDLKQRPHGQGNNIITGFSPM